MLRLTALLSLGLVACVSSCLRGRRVVLVCRDDAGRARRVLLSQGAFAARFSALLALVLAVSGSELDNFTAQDKRAHAAVGLAIGLLGAEAADCLLPQHAPTWQRWALALAPVVVAGVGKELYDGQHRDRHTPEARDAIATIFGGAVGITLRFTF